MIGAAGKCNVNSKLNHAINLTTYHRISNPNIRRISQSVSSHFTPRLSQQNTFSIHYQVWLFKNWLTAKVSWRTLVWNPPYPRLSIPPFSKRATNGRINHNLAIVFWVLQGLGREYSTYEFVCAWVLEVMSGLIWSVRPHTITYFMVCLLFVQFFLFTSNYKLILRILRWLTDWNLWT